MTTFWNLIAFLAAIVAVGIVQFFRPPRSLFCIRIRKGRMIVRHGSIHPAFLRDCKEIVEPPSIETWSIYDVMGSNGMTPRFSASLPSGVQQRLRNAFHFHRQ